MLETKVVESSQLADAGMVEQFNTLRKEAAGIIGNERLPELPELASAKDSYAAIYSKSRVLEMLLPVDVSRPRVGRGEVVDSSFRPEMG
jgi:hypothetical protein